MNFFAIIAQVAADHSILYTQGPLGVMVAYFILRGEKLAATVTRELGDMKETMLLDIASRAYAPKEIREMAQEKLDAIEAKRKQDK